MLNFRPMLWRLIQRIALAALLFAGVLPCVQASQLNTGNYFLVTFQVNQLNCPLGSCDTIFFSPAFTSAPASAGTVSAQLLNGTQLLGTYSTANPAFCCTAGFESANSAFGPYGVLADFTTLANGTIQGQFTYAVTGVLDGFDPTQSYFALGHATGPGGLTVSGDAFQITDEEIITKPIPEPATLLMTGLAGVLLIGGSVVWKKRRVS